MQKKYLIISIIVAVIVLSVIAFILVTQSRPADIRISSVTTDKNLYHSNEVMMMTIMIISPDFRGDTLVKIEGIQDRHGQTRLSHLIPANLTPGSNVFLYNYNLPACSRCAGLDPGSYPVNVTLEKAGTILSTMSISVNLEQ